MHWSRLVDAPIAAIMLAASPLPAAWRGRNRRADRLAGAAFLPRAVSSSCGSRALSAAKRRFCPRVVIGAAALHFIGIFAPGAIDHHNVQLVLASGQPVPAARGARKRPAALLAGACGRADAGGRHGNRALRRGRSASAWPGCSCSAARRDAEIARQFRTGLCRRRGAGVLRHRSGLQLGGRAMRCLFRRAVRRCGARRPRARRGRIGRSREPDACPAADRARSARRRGRRGRASGFPAMHCRSLFHARRKAAQGLARSCCREAQADLVHADRFRARRWSSQLHDAAHRPCPGWRFRCRGRPCAPASNSSSARFWPPLSRSASGRCAARRSPSLSPSSRCRPGSATWRAAGGGQPVGIGCGLKMVARAWLVSLNVELERGGGRGHRRRPGAQCSRRGRRPRPPGIANAARIMRRWPQLPASNGACDLQSRLADPQPTRTIALWPAPITAMSRATCWLSTRIHGMPRRGAGDRRAPSGRPSRRFAPAMTETRRSTPGVARWISGDAPRWRCAGLAGAGRRQRQPAAPESIGCEPGTELA